MAGGTDAEELKLMINMAEARSFLQLPLKRAHGAVHVHFRDAPAARTDEVIAVMSRADENEVHRALVQPHPPHHAMCLQLHQQAVDRRRVALLAQRRRARQFTDGHWIVPTRNFADEQVQRPRAAQPTRAEALRTNIGEGIYFDLFHFLQEGPGFAA